MGVAVWQEEGVKVEGTWEEEYVAQDHIVY